MKEKRGNFKILKERNVSIPARILFQLKLQFVGMEFSQQLGVTSIDPGVHNVDRYRQA